jgi:hypothetical protein
MNLKKYFVVSFVLILLVSLNVYGEVNLSKSGMISSRPTVAVNQDGVILVVWTDSDFSDEAGMLWYNVNKNGVWEGPKDARISRERCWSPQLDIDSKGNFHLVYADGNSRLSREIFHCVYDPETGWSNPEMIYNSPENSAWAKLQIINDIIYVVWYHENVDPYMGSDTVLHSKAVDDKYWPASYLRITYTANQVSIHPAFKIKDGRLYVCNMGKETDNVPWRIFYKEDQLDGSWQSFRAEQIVPYGYYPELEVDDDGNVHIIFSNRSGNFYYKSKIGDNWRGNEVISNGFARLQFGDLKYKNQLLVAAWVEKINEETFLYYSKKIIGGDWETPVQISTGKQARMPKIWLDGNGNGYFVWVDKSWAHERDVFYEKIALPFSSPFLQLSLDSLSFTLEGDIPDPATFTVKNIGEDPLTFNISTDQSWLSATPASGTLDYQEEIEIQAEIADLTLDEGTYTGIIEVSSPEAVNSPRQIEVQLEVLVPPIFAPLNFTGEVKENRALFYREYIHDLSWEPNPDNSNIVKYELYEIDGGSRIFIQQFSSSTFRYFRRNVDGDKAYTYELYAVDDKDRMGAVPAVLVIQ